jgi:hypothetical protein
MKVIEIKKIENCMEGRNVRDLYFEGKISKDFVGYLSSLGKMVYHNFNPKPYFDLIVKGQYTLKGSIGNPYARLLLPDDSGDDHISGLVEFIENYNTQR